MSVGGPLREALRENRRVREGDAAEAAKRLARAVADVNEGHTLDNARRNRGVDYDALRAELERQGWTPPGRTRQSRSRAKQLPRRRGDNQS